MKEWSRINLWVLGCFEVCSFRPNNYRENPAGWGDLVSEYDFGDNASYDHSYDAQWNTEALLDDGGSQQAAYKYRAFGLVQREEGPASTKLAFVGKQGYYRDEELGLYLLGAANASGGGRAYDPATGRFLSEDPAKDDLNEYRYVRNNPVNVIDPSGQACQKPNAINQPGQKR